MIRCIPTFDLESAAVRSANLISEFTVYVNIIHLYDQTLYLYLHIIHLYVQIIHLLNYFQHVAMLRHVQDGILCQGTL